LAGLILKVITEGGLRKEWERRAERGRVKGTGIGRVVRWPEHLNFPVYGLFFLFF